MTDTLVFYSGPDPYETWRDALAPHLGDHVRIENADAVTDPDTVRFALVWMPPEGFFARFPNLELVINLGAGVDRLVARDDLPDVPITRLSDPEMGRMMAGYVLFSVLRHAREIPHFEAAQARREWALSASARGQRHHGCRAGAGRAGRAGGDRDRPPGFRHPRLGHAPARPGRGAGALRRRGAGPAAGHVRHRGMHVAADPRGTRKRLDAAAFAAMKPGAAFVNVSRGEVVDEAALVGALRAGHLSGATLDVFESEPLGADHPLWTLPGVLVTPHLASVALPKSAAPQIAANIRAIQTGDALINVVSRVRGY